MFSQGENLAQPFHAVAVERMIAVLREENAALASMDFARAGDLLTVKFGAADALASVWRSNQQAALSLSTKRVLSNLADENRTLIKATMAAQIRALDQVARVIKASPDRPMARASRN